MEGYPLKTLLELRRREEAAAEAIWRAAQVAVKVAEAALDARNEAVAAARARLREARAAEAVGRNVQRALSRSFTVDKRKLSITGSIGISFYPENGADSDNLLRAADYAMYLAKREGGNRHLICPPDAPHLREAAKE